MKAARKLILKLFFYEAIIAYIILYYNQYSKKFVRPVKVCLDIDYTMNDEIVINDKINN